MEVSGITPSDEKTSLLKNSSAKTNLSTTTNQIEIYDDHEPLQNHTHIKKERKQTSNLTYAFTANEFKTKDFKEKILKNNYEYISNLWKIINPVAPHLRPIHPLKSFFTITNDVEEFISIFERVDLHDHPNACQGLLWNFMWENVFEELGLQRIRISGFFGEYFEKNKQRAKDRFKNSLKNLPQNHFLKDIPTHLYKFCNIIVKRNIEKNHKLIQINQILNYLKYILDLEALSTLTDSNIEELDNMFNTIQTLLNDQNTRNNQHQDHGLECQAVHSLSTVMIKVDKIVQSMERKSESWTKEIFHLCFQTILPIVNQNIEQETEINASEKEKKTKKVELNAIEEELLFIILPSIFNIKRSDEEIKNSFHKFIGNANAADEGKKPNKSNINILDYLHKKRQSKIYPTNETDYQESIEMKNNAYGKDRQGELLNHISKCTNLANPELDKDWGALSIFLRGIQVDVEMDAQNVEMLSDYLCHEYLIIFLSQSKQRSIVYCRIDTIALTLDILLCMANKKKSFWFRILDDKSINLLKELHDKEKLMVTLFFYKLFKQNEEAPQMLLRMDNLIEYLADILSNLMVKKYEDLTTEESQIAIILIKIFYRILFYFRDKPTLLEEQLLYLKMQKMLQDTVVTQVFLKLTYQSLGDKTQNGFFSWAKEEYFTKNEKSFEFENNSKVEGIYYFYHILKLFRLSTEKLYLYEVQKSVLDFINGPQFTKLKNLDWMIENSIYFRYFLELVMTINNFLLKSYTVINKHINFDEINQPTNSEASSKVEVAGILKDKLQIIIDREEQIAKKFDEKFQKFFKESINNETNASKKDLDSHLQQSSTNQTNFREASKTTTYVSDANHEKKLKNHGQINAYVKNVSNPTNDEENEKREMHQHLHSNICQFFIENFYSKTCLLKINTIQIDLIDTNKKKLEKNKYFLVLSPIFKILDFLYIHNLEADIEVMVSILKDIIKDSNALLNLAEFDHIIKMEPKDLLAKREEVFKKFPTHTMGNVIFEYRYLVYKLKGSIPAQHLWIFKKTCLAMGETNKQEKLLRKCIGKCNNAIQPIRREEHPKLPFLEICDHKPKKDILNQQVSQNEKQIEKNRNQKLVNFFDENPKSYYTNLAKFLFTFLLDVDITSVCFNKKEWQALNLLNHILYISSDFNDYVHKYLSNINKVEEFLNFLWRLLYDSYTNLHCVENLSKVILIQDRFLEEKKTRLILSILTNLCENLHDPFKQLFASMAITPPLKISSRWKNNFDWKKDEDKILLNQIIFLYFEHELDQGTKETDFCKYPALRISFVRFLTEIASGPFIAAQEVISKAVELQNYGSLKKLYKNFGGYDDPQKSTDSNNCQGTESNKTEGKNATTSKDETEYKKSTQKKKKKLNLIFSMFLLLDLNHH